MRLKKYCGPLSSVRGLDVMPIDPRREFRVVHTHLAEVHLHLDELTVGDVRALRYERNRIAVKSEAARDGERGERLKVTWFLERHASGKPGKDERGSACPARAPRHTGCPQPDNRIQPEMAM